MSDPARSLTSTSSHLSQGMRILAVLAVLAANAVLGWYMRGAIAIATYLIDAFDADARQAEDYDALILIGGFGAAASMGAFLMLNTPLYLLLDRYEIKWWWWGGALLCFLAPLPISVAIYRFKYGYW